MQAFAVFARLDLVLQYVISLESDGHEGLLAKLCTGSLVDLLYSSCLFQRAKFLFDIGNLHCAREAATVRKEEGWSASDSIGFSKRHIFI